MDPYLDALRAMHELLDALGQQDWLEWIAQDIDEWERAKSAEHHLSAYGGIGSFNDTWIKDVWLGALFQDLQSLCYHFAHHPTGKPDVKDLQLGSYWIELASWRCFACAYVAISHQNIDHYIARRVIREHILRAAERIQLQEFVRSVILCRRMNHSRTARSPTGWSGVEFTFVKTTMRCELVLSAVARTLQAIGGCLSTEAISFRQHNNYLIRTEAARNRVQAVAFGVSSAVVLCCLNDRAKRFSES